MQKFHGCSVQWQCIGIYLSKLYGTKGEFNKSIFILCQQTHICDSNNISLIFFLTLEYEIIYDAWRSVSFSHSLCVRECLPYSRRHHRKILINFQSKCYSKQSKVKQQVLILNECITKRLIWDALAFWPTLPQCHRNIILFIIASKVSTIQRAQPFFRINDSTHELKCSKHASLFI